MLSASAIAQMQMRAHKNEENHHFKLIHMRDNERK